MSRKFTVPVALPANPTQPLEAAPKQYVDACPSYNFVQDTVPTPTLAGQTWFNTTVGEGTSWVAISEVPGSAGPLNWVQFTGAGLPGPPGPTGPAGGAVTTAAQLPFVPTGNIIASNVQTAIAEVATDAAALMSPPWIAMTPYLINGWVNYGVPFGPLYFRKVGDITYLRGLTNGGAAGSMLCTLPVGYRPLYDPIFTCPCNLGTVEVRVSTTGTVQITTSYSTGASPSTWTSVSPVFFSTI